MQIRNAREADSDELWVLMRDLAIFEKYIDSFATTPEVVRDSGFRKNPPDFHCIVAEAGSKIVGMLVYYFLPYTAQNRPAIYMKELFVSEGHRGHGIGQQLMDVLQVAAKTPRWRVTVTPSCGRGSHGPTRSLTGHFVGRATYMRRGHQRYPRQKRAGHSGNRSAVHAAGVDHRLISTPLITKRSNHFAAGPAIAKRY